MDEWLVRARKHRPARTALIDARSDRHWSYRELSAWAEEIASLLRDRGVDPGDPVGLLATRHPLTIASLWGVFRAGGILVPLPPEGPDAEIRSRSDRAGAGILLDPAAGDRRLPEVRRRSRGSPPNWVGDAHHPIDRPQVVLFTSGTTGAPTGVRLTGRNLGASAASTVARVGAGPEARWFLDLPLYHAGGLSIPVRTAMLGATTVLNPAFDAEESARRMREYEVSGVSLVPTMLDRLLGGHGLPSRLDFTLVGGAQTSPALVERALDAGVPIYATYGMTETASGIATATPSELRERPDTVGRPVRAAQVSILAEDDRPVGPETVGEIAVSGPLVSPGTVDGGKRPPGTPFQTGDRGYFTPEGQLVVTGRVDEMIVTGGENVSPREVEAALRRLEGIEAAAVVGLPDATWGERVIAAVRTTGSGPLGTEEVRTQLRGRLADHKLPKAVHVLDSLPRTPSGTVDRETLRERLRD
ncbi:MAG: class I adenylate-forming enzyme family protein [Halodesulfurarchaeum sp.]